ncbi:ARF-like 2-binding protein [Novymonas esmeraldas]|uniref:ARF-like 2-binding protein n=1 Tax=Novymonas esmeraldas TaxID=1808958 RepID=A0AAW0ERI2_9TRYP
MDTDEGEFIICGDGGTPEDAAFDALVGAIEDFMITFDAEQVWQAVPPLHTVQSDHERHTIFTAFLAEVERRLDAHVLAACGDGSSIEEVGALLQRRHEDITPEVWEFVSEGCFDYETFMEQWKSRPH